MGLWSRVKGAFVGKGAEGEFHPGPYFTGDGWLPAGTPWNFWQMGQNPRPYSGASAMVEACIAAYSQTTAMCPGDHWRLKSDGGRERVTTSALARILRKPNDYQSISDFLLNLTRSLYADGNAYALAIRNDRFEIAEMHLMQSRSCYPRVAEDGSIFYALGGNEIIDSRLGALAAVPARDVMHVRLHTPRHPLKGETPLLAAALSEAMGNAALQQQIAFFSNQARPSIMLSTDQVLTATQAAELRARWNEQTRGEGAGGTPILTGGLKPVTVSTTARDAEIAELLKKSDQDIALAYRVPLHILGLGGPVQGSTESLMQSWKASGLGFCLNHIEEAFGRMFGLRGVPEEYVEFDTDALMRSAFKDRIEALARGVQGGVFAPDEARAQMELPKVPGGYGEEPRVQQQDVPLSAWEKGQVAQPATPAPPAPPAPDEAEEPEDAERANPDAILRRLYDHRLH
ncbi:phage portal protein [Thauera sp.]|uniref:phage portal protein n=1 Tax=Thauera sp. TaxID=1905334 RepID=UPI002B795BA9|nr:phage portal protein [Thauera sp.]HRP26032.1 phage portal protein [Thauera sp.]